MRTKKHITKTLKTIVVFICFQIFLAGLNAQTFPGTTGALTDNNCSGSFNTFTATVTGVGPTDIIQNVTLNISHTWVSELNLFLEGPNGQKLELSTGNGGGGDNYTNTVFADASTTFISSGSPPFTGSFKPEGRANNDNQCDPAGTVGTYMFASQFWGANCNGNWILKIKDAGPGDAGFLNSWSVTIVPQTQQQNIGINILNPQATLDVNGKIKVGNDQATEVAGMIRYTSMSNDFEGYNGTTWKSMTGSNFSIKRINDADNNTSVDVETNPNENIIRFHLTGTENYTMFPTRIHVNTGDNTYFGRSSGINNSSGQYNSSFGENAMGNNTTGSFNAAFGTGALVSNNSGGSNSAFGYSALFFNTTGNYNTAVGRNAMGLNTTGSNNSAVGRRALFSNTTGIENSAFGYEAMYSNTSANLNSAFGSGALHENTTGISNSAFGYNALFSNITGRINSAFGVYSLSANTTGEENSAFGNQALGFNTTGWYNSAFGRSSLLSNSTGWSNSAFGYDALHGNSYGNSNTAVGSQALFNNTSGDDNSAIGTSALLHNTTGDNNIAFGKNAGSFDSSSSVNQTSSSSIYIGVDSKSSNNGNINEIVIGHGAVGSGNNTVTIGNSSTTSTIIKGAATYSPIGTNSGQTGQVKFQELAANGTNAVTFRSPDNLAADVTFNLPSSSGTNGQILSTDGYGGLSWITSGSSGNGLVHPTAGSTFESGYYNVNITGTRNTAIGSTALINNTIGNHNSAFGDSTLLNNSTGNSNTAMGFQAMWGNTTGTWNSSFGVTSLLLNTTGSENSAFGVSALGYNTTGNFNSAFGRRALFSNTTGYNNSAFGKYALYFNTVGNDNSAFGREALYSNTIGWENSAFGIEALYSNISGNNNSAFGKYALYHNTTGSLNLAFGNQALYSNTSGYDNSAFGILSLAGNTTGFYNSAFGDGALTSNTLGSSNAAFGNGSLTNNTTGNANTAIGVGAFLLGNNFSNSTAVGYYASITASNQVRLGDASVSSIGGYEPWTDLSDVRFKKEINQNVIGLDFIMRLKPITYQLDIVGLNNFLNFPDSLRNIDVEMGKESVVRHGFLAQEVEATANSLGFSFNGVDAPKNENDHYGLRYSIFVVPLVKAVQEQQEIIEDMKRENGLLKDAILLAEQKLNQLIQVMQEIRSNKSINTK
jgi:subtilisin-like proprotein convertase family protein